MRLTTLSTALASCILVACVTDSPVDRPDKDSGTVNPPVDAGADQGSPDAQPEASPVLATFSIQPATPFVRRKGSVDVTVTVARGSLTGAIPLSVTGLPTGVTFTPAAVAGGATTATLHFDATDTATEGLAQLTLSAKGATDLKFQLLVGGDPGTLDESFDSDGILLDTSFAGNVFYDLVVQPDGKIVAVGTTAPGGGMWLARRYADDGTEDTAFEQGFGSILPKSKAARGVAIDPNGDKVVIAGSTAGNSEEITLVRVNANGKPDQTVNGTGAITTTSVFFPQGARANAVAVMSDSSIVIAGQSIASKLGLVAKFAAKDATEVTSGFTRYESPGGEFTALQHLANGQWLASGTDLTISPNAIGVARLDANGKPDSTFGTGGYHTFAQYANGLGAALATGGDLLVAGEDITGPSYSQSRIDVSGAGTLLWHKNTGGGSSARFTCAAPGPGDSTYVAGYGGGTYDKSSLLQRNLKGGALDTTFATGGVLTLEDSQSPDTYFYQLHAAAVDSYGRVLVAGARLGASPGAVIFRVWP